VDLSNRSSYASRPSVEVALAHDVTAALKCDRLAPIEPDLARVGGRSGDDFPLLSGMSGDEHTIRRKLIASAFTSRAVDGWSAEMRLTARRLAVSIPGGGVCDIGPAFATPFTRETAAMFVGLASVDVANTALSLSLGLLDQHYTPVRKRLSAVRLWLLLESVIEHDDQLDPRSILGRLHAVVPRADVVGACMSMLAAGTGITARAILAAARGATRVKDAAFVQECERTDASLAADGIVEWVERFATDDVTLPSGLRLHKGEAARIKLCANGEQARVFGFGDHYCLGAAWVRLACRISVEELFRAHPGATEVRSRTDRQSSPVDTGGVVSLQLQC
jgi:cytochrome P450